LFPKLNIGRKYNPESTSCVEAYVREMAEGFEHSEAEWLNA
jgi:hypothetical protein